MLGRKALHVNDRNFSFKSVSQIIGYRNYRVESGGASEYRQGSIE